MVTKSINTVVNCTNSRTLILPTQYSVLSGLHEYLLINLQANFNYFNIVKVILYCNNVHNVGVSIVYFLYASFGVRTVQSTHATTNKNRMLWGMKTFPLQKHWDQVYFYSLLGHHQHQSSYIYVAVRPFISVSGLKSTPLMRVFRNV